MAWFYTHSTFSREREEVSLRISCWDISQSELSRLIRTAAKHSLPDRPISYFRDSQSGMMCVLFDQIIRNAYLSSIDYGGLLDSLPYAEVRLVSRFRSREKEKQAKTSATCGLKQSGSFAKYDPVSHSWKTCTGSYRLEKNSISLFLKRFPSLSFVFKKHRSRSQGDLFAVSTRLSEITSSDKYSGGWPKSGTMRSGQCWELPTLKLRTTDTGCGYSLPTPSATSYGTNQGGSAGRTGKIRPSLETMARTGIFPTPRAGDAKNGDYQYDQGDHSKPRLTLSGIAKMYPTPSASMMTTQDMEQARFSGSDQRRPKYAEVFPTPTVGDSKQNGPPSQYKRHTKPLNAVIGGKLNPDWVAWLMGWPIAWESLKPLPRESFTAWLQSRDWWAREPEGVSRTTTDTRNRVSRIKALGNGQVPLCAAIAFLVLMNRLNSALPDKQ